MIYLPSLASPIVAFNTSSGKESSNLRNDEASDSRQSSFVTKFFSGVNEAVVVACFDSLQVLCFFRFSTSCDDNSTCLLRNRIIYLPSLASDIVAFKTSSLNESSNLRKDAPRTPGSPLLLPSFLQGQ